MVSIFIFIVGLCIGSFLNVVIFRLNRKRGIFTGRSECPRCLKKLRWYDLFPVLSFIVLKRKCRNCKNKISFVYPIIELVTAFCVILFYLVHKPTLDVVNLYYLIIIISFVALIFFDYLYLLIPDKIILPLIIISVLLGYFIRRPEFLGLLLSALIMGSIFVIMYLVSGGKWVGLGDAKLLFLIGLVLGYPLGFLSLIFSVWIAALVGIILIVLGRATRKTALPFGSFLAGISILIIIFQDEISQFFGFFFN